MYTSSAKIYDSDVGVYASATCEHVTLTEKKNVKNAIYQLVPHVYK